MTQRELDAALSLAYWVRENKEDNSSINHRRVLEAAVALGRFCRYPKQRKRKVKAK